VKLSFQAFVPPGGEESRLLDERLFVLDLHHGRLLIPVVVTWKVELNKLVFRTA
jgi:hypothetical protein